ncbi:MAG: hypothetical protein P1U47_08130 [Zhongshania sp.]|nr:hypothetical protein [Zhongshania sp.]
MQLRCAGIDDGAPQGIIAHRIRKSILWRRSATIAGLYVLMDLFSWPPV